ncbi:UNVERIFIED_CONTAM: hypothetical protein Sangu_2003800 [Sesamum angustifolium]|uniref:Uncharacterized protein n=1 Tax=Sesamum angustifolium TaxID=2727405 RepID=A0AAW2LL93_9LAMI
MQLSRLIGIVEIKSLHEETLSLHEETLTLTQSLHQESHKSLKKRSKPCECCSRKIRLNSMDNFTYDPDCHNCFAESMCAMYCIDDYEVHMQKNLDAPMPWIGMYIAAASALCSLAMAVDAFNGFRTKKFWFPCKYFSLNAASLTLLGVAMKLTVDLTSSMMGLNDKIATVSSLVLISTAMCNFVTSLACMDNNECLLNLTALGILVFTIAGNVCIHNQQTSDVLDGQVVLAEEMATTIFMLLLFAILCSWSVAVPTARRYIESKYLHAQDRFG